MVEGEGQEMVLEARESDIKVGNAAPMCMSSAEEGAPSLTCHIEATRMEPGFPSGSGKVAPEPCIV
jgi:hypothetical protein